MNHTLETVFAALAVVVTCSMPLASNTQAQTCNPPLGGGTDNVAGLGARTSMANWAMGPAPSASRRCEYRT
jgi:hypothetical protein